MSQIIKQILGGSAVHMQPGGDGSMLVLSMRRVADLAGYCLQYEFEDVVGETTGADRAELAELGPLEFQRRVYRALHSVTSSALAMRVAPQLGGLRLNKTYEVFLPVFNHPYEVFALNAIPGWRERCGYAACIISEAVEERLPEYLLESLASFDRVYLSSNPTDSVSRITGLPCGYLPLGIDALTFCPYPEPPGRSIDVLGIGRRSDVTHQALLDLARGPGFFYYYDTVRMTAGVANAGRQITFSVTDPAEHRFKLASLLKRSRYYLASRARANEKGSDVSEISSRFFEGAAAGAIMIGEPPLGGRFDSLFDWPDAVIKTPFDDPDIGGVLAKLDADSDRCTKIRRNSMLNAVRRHDHVYRLRTILEDAGLPMPPGVLAREARLRELADQIESAAVLP